MTALLILFALLTFIVGQLLLKLALNKFAEANGNSSQRTKAAWIFAASILSMAASFFVNLGLLRNLDLSFLFPFQGLSVIIVAFSSAFFLRERLSAGLIVGVILITAGVILVSSS